LLTAFIFRISQKSKLFLGTFVAFTLFIEFLCSLGPHGGASEMAINPFCFDSAFMAEVAHVPSTIKKEGRA
jgi:hypothetical protein